MARRTARAATGATGAPAGSGFGGMRMASILRGDARAVNHPGAFEPLGGDAFETATRIATQSAPTRARPATDADRVLP